MKIEKVNEPQWSITVTEKAYWKAKAEIWKEAAEEFKDYLCGRGFNAIMERVKLHN